MPIDKDNTSVCSNTQVSACCSDCSNVFRVEKLDGDAATFRVLIPNPDTTATTQPYVGTNSFFTMSLGCLCTIRCLNDTYIDCV